MPLYESVFIARQDVATTQVEALAAQFAEIIRNQGGKVTKTEQWGLRTLAYRIKKNKKGHYVLFNIDASAAALQEMERNMRLNEDVLRYMSVKVDVLEEGPSAMLRRSEERDSFDRGGDRGDRGMAPRSGGFERSTAPRAVGSGRPMRRDSSEGDMA